MNTQMERARGHSAHEEDPPHMHDQDVDMQTGHDENHGDKKSVLNKVKAKAKKIKNSIVEHVGHGHELHDDDHDEVADEDHEMDTDPETHGTQTTQSFSFRPEEVRVTKQHEPRLGDRTAVEGAPVSKPGDYQTSDWTRTDIGRPKESKEQPYELRNTPVVDMERPIGTQASKDVGEARHPANYQAKVADPTSTENYLGRTHGAGAEERNTGKLGGIVENPPHLKKDPHAPKVPGEKRHAENYESKVSDPIGEGAEEIGVTPVLHQLDNMSINQKPNVRSGQKESMFKPKHSLEDEKISTGSHNQFSPEPIIPETSKFLQTPESGSLSSGHEGWNDKSEQKQESYTEKISSAAAMMADKAKQATSSVTSMLGYGGNSDHRSTTTESSGLQSKQSETRGYVEKMSTATAAIVDKAAQAKDVVATNLGYGGTHEGKPVQEGTSKGGSLIETVKGTVAPVYNKVAEVGSTMASKVQGSGTGREVGPNTTAGPAAGTGKGVSMKEYLVEKLKPGEDDKALSDVITEALPLHKHKEDVSKAGEEGEGKKVNLKGKVTESEEVARQLGRSEDASYDHAKGVIDRVKDAFGYQKSGETPATDAAGAHKGSSSISSKKEEQKRE